MNRRMSNVELLRILSMLMIIAHHLVGHGLNYLNDKTLWYSGSSLNRAFSSLFILGGSVGVNLFFMISGYFLCKNNTIKLKKIIQTSFFYVVITLGIYILYSYLTSGYVDVSIKQVISYSRPVTNNIWWFITTYFWLMLIHPIINSIIMKLNKLGVSVCILCIMVLYIFSGLYSLGTYSIDRAVVNYLLGAYINNYVKENKKNIIHIVLFIGFWLLGSFGYYYLPGSFSFIRMGIGLIIGLICSFELFVFIINYSFNNRLIDLLGKTTFGIYLLHDSTLLRIIIWNNLFKVPDAYQSIYFPILSIGIIVIVFVVGASIDLLREKFVSPLLDYIYGKIYLFYCRKLMK